VIGPETKKTALEHLKSRARVDGKEYDLKTRWAHENGVVYVETEPGRVWEIDKKGWRLCETPPVRFRQVDMLRPLPDPEKGGTHKDLERYLKLPLPAFRLVLSVMVTYPFDDATSPILGYFGVHGSGKSTRSLFTKQLLDEDGSDYMSPDGDVLRKARHRGIVVFDNQSSFPKGFADLLASLVTGSGDSKRELYTTDTEYAFKVKGPVIVNGINIPSDRADLLSRFVAIEVPAITSEQRISEAEFWAAFERDRGKLLGAYFDILSGVLRNRKPVSWRPRMSDWGELASALYDYMGWGHGLGTRHVQARPRSSGAQAARRGPGDHRRYGPDAVPLRRVRRRQARDHPTQGGFLS